MVGAFQSRANFEAVEHRYRRLAAVADACLVFADFDELVEEDAGPVRIPIGPEDALGNEWAVVIDAPGYACCLLAWETPESQRDAQPGRARAALRGDVDDGARARSAAPPSSAPQLARRASDPIGRRLEELLQDRPLAFEAPAPALTALTNRIVAYMERS